MKLEANMQLAAITTDLPDYTLIRNTFFEHFPLFWKLGAVNYACLTRYTGFSGFTHEIVAVYLCGLAMGKLSEYSDNYHGDEDIWNPLFAWSLIEDEIKFLRPVLRLPAPAEIEVEIPPQKRKRA